MDIQKVDAAYAEMVELQKELEQATQDKIYFANFLKGDNLSSDEWQRYSTGYVRANDIIRKNTARIKILKGRIHFELSTI